MEHCMGFDELDSISPYKCMIHQTHFKKKSCRLDPGTPNQFRWRGICIIKLIQGVPQESA